MNEFTGKIGISKFVGTGDQKPHSDSGDYAWVEGGPRMFQNMVELRTGAVQGEPGADPKEIDAFLLRMLSISDNQAAVTNE